MYKLIDYKITNQTKFNLNSITDEIEVVGRLPITSKIDCVVFTPCGSYKFYLTYKETINEGNVFGSPFIINSDTIRLLRLKPELNIKIQFIVDKIIVSDLIEVSIGPKVVSNVDKTYSYVIQEINNIKQCLVESHKELSCDNVKKGMIPYATGFDNKYIWDYPSDYEELFKQVKDLASVVNKQAQLIVELTNRLNTLDEKLTVHINEENIL